MLNPSLPWQHSIYMYIHVPFTPQCPIKGLDTYLSLPHCSLSPSLSPSPSPSPSSLSIPLSLVLEELPSFEDHLHSLFKVVHVGPISIGIQSLLLLHQVMESRQSVSERYYNALYSKLLDPALRHCHRQVCVNRNPKNPIHLTGFGLAVPVSSLGPSPMVLALAWTQKRQEK